MRSLNILHLRKGLVRHAVEIATGSMFSDLDHLRACLDVADAADVRALTDHLLHRFEVTDPLVLLMVKRQACRSTLIEQRSKPLWVRRR